MKFFELDILEEERIEYLFKEPKSMKEIPIIQPTVMGDPKSNISIIFQHGFIGANIDFLYIANFFAKSGYRCFLPILPGHGRDWKYLHLSTHKEWMSSLTEVIDMALEENPLRAIILCGHSLGGTISLFQATHDKRINGVITIAAPINYTKPIHWLSRIIAKISPSFKVKYKEFKFADKHLMTHPYILDIRKRFPYVTAHTLKEVISLLDVVRSQLDEVMVPVLIIHSKKDRTVPPWNSSGIYKKISSDKKEIHKYKQSYHIIVADYDKLRLIGDISNFIKNTLGLNCVQ